LTLPPSIQGLLADGKLTAGHAKALLGSPDRAYQEQIARRAADEGWSVRAVEEAIRDRGLEHAGLDGGGSTSTNSGGTTRPVSRLRQPAVLELEQRFSDYLGTKVEVKMTGVNKKGSVTITFAGLEDLERIYLLMMGAGDLDPEE
jgi:ParB family chromosome partitioning protein